MADSADDPRSLTCSCCCWLRSHSNAVTVSSGHAETAAGDGVAVVPLWPIRQTVGVVGCANERRDRHQVGAAGAACVLPTPSGMRLGTWLGSWCCVCRRLRLACGWALGSGLHARGALASRLSAQMPLLLLAVPSHFTAGGRAGAETAAGDGVAVLL